MNKKFLVALAAIAAIIIFLVFSLYYSGDYPFTGPGLPKKLAKKTQTVPDSKAKPGPMTAPAPKTAPDPHAAPAAPSVTAPTPAKATQTPPPAPPAPGAASPEKAVTKPGAAAPKPPKLELQPLEPTKEYGLLVRRYRGYYSAGKKMAKLKKKDLPAFIRRRKGRYEVWAGPFATRQEALKAAKSIKGKRRRRLRVQQITIPVPK